MSVKYFKHAQVQNFTIPQVGKLPHNFSVFHSFDVFVIPTTQNIFNNEIEIRYY